MLTAVAWAHTYHGEGMILQVDGERRIITISHRAIPGYMPAMVMPFPVSGQISLAAWKPGQQVRFDLSTSGGRAMISRLLLIESASQDFPIPKPAHELHTGERVPDFSLQDQHGQPVRLSALRGRTIVLNFIYTRCPLPEVCPRLTASFAALQHRFAGRRLTLLSVTLDPQYDTPEVLRTYAQRAGARAPGWRFLTGPLTEVARIAGLFGIVYWPEEGSLTHTSRTAMIDENGQLAAVVEGSGFNLRHLSDLVAAHLPAEVP